MPLNFKLLQAWNSYRKYHFVFLCILQASQDHGKAGGTEQSALTHYSYPCTMFLLCVVAGFHLQNTEKVDIIFTDCIIVL